MTRCVLRQGSARRQRRPLKFFAMEPHDENPASSLSLDGRIFHVVASEAASEIDRRTILRCKQRGPIVIATYRGGRVRNGYLIGKWKGEELACDYIQVSTDDIVDKGHSVCRAR